MERVWIAFADNGNIRKWQSAPFDGASEYRLAAALEATARPPDAELASDYKARHVRMLDYSTDLQRIIEDLCAGRDIREPFTSARHHYQMAVHHTAPPARGQVEVKALEWRVPTDHPADPDIEENVYCADGIGGRYAISKKQTVGPKRLLWMADDPFVWAGFNSIPEAKAAAQADYERRILSALSVQPEPKAEVTEALHNARVLLKALTSPDDAVARATIECIEKAEAALGART